MRPLDISSPRVKRPSEGHELTEQLEWQPYPRLGISTVYARYGIQDQSFSLRQIGAQMMPVLLSGKRSESPLPDQIILDNSTRLACLDDLEYKLNDWYRNLPHYVEIDLTLLPMTEQIPTSTLLDLQYVSGTYLAITCSIANQRPWPPAWLLQTECNDYNA